ncbi:MAG: V-type ATP synthase subunit I [Deltaproteobacteria bacterium]|nr:V-type ATP synthase subunit I [Deltaproteobacteria bacterium]MBW2332318.1 V-type ATP synthase subunit I [Deltaproteobacteria bacterium]
MKRIQILALEGFRYQVIRRLQALGAIHLTDYSEKLEDPIWKNLLRPHPPSANIRTIAALNIAINRFLDLFERYDPEQKEGFIKGIFAPKPPKRIETREVYGKELINAVNEIIEKIEQETEKPVQELEKIEEEIIESERIKGLLELILNLEIDLKDVSESDFLSISLGIVPKEEVDTVRERLEELTKGNFYLGVRETSENKLVTLLICLKEQASLVLANLRRINWEKIEIVGQQGTPNEARDSINKRILALTEEKTKKEAIVVDIAKRWRDELEKYREFLAMERQREESQNKFAQMENVVAIQGWVPENAAAQAAQEIEEVSDGACVVEISDPEEMDDVPVLLKNPKFIRSFELLTRLYGMPTYNGVDPTLILVPGFLLFFSIMLTDAMYGVIALVLGLLLIRGGGKYNLFIKDAGVILSSAGVATIIIGALAGGWLGGFGLKAPALKAMQIFDPMVQVTAFLLIALIIGLAHVNVGVVINVWNMLRRRELWKAVTGNLWFLFAQPGIFFFLAGYRSVGLLFIVIALALLFLGHKAMAMFQVTGFMGDVLSYARLMALGLCTTGIAMTVNVLSGMLYAGSSIGILFAIVVFFIGHLFNFVINAMGAFVHGLRLHYVELFTKFFESGGTEFSPLETGYEVVEIK